MISAQGRRTGLQQGERVDVREELDRLESMIKDLRLQYEQYFTGLLPLPPDKLHADVKRMLRHLRKAPFKSSAMSYRLRTLDGRYATWNTYWQRVLREREEGTYSKDVFKANLRERIAQEEAKAETAEGAAEKSFQNLFHAYQSALEKHQGKRPDIDFNKFKESLVARAKEFRQKHADKKLAFKVVVKGGKVVVQAKVKE